MDNFEQFLDSLSNLDMIAPRQDQAMQIEIDSIINELKKIGTITPSNLAEFIQRFPNSVPIIATSAGLGQEQLKNQLRLKMKTTGWVTLARKRSDELIQFLDTEFGIVQQLNREINKDWTFSEVLVERHLWSKSQGASAVGRGRKIEDEVEKIAVSLGLPYAMRTRFVGRNGETAPCDLAIPAGNDDALIVVGMKGFNSTGSKLSDAVVEIEKMANVRQARQFVFAVIDGIGWLSRQADLKKIYSLWEKKQIDGLYTLQTLEQFEKDLSDAALRLNIKK